MKLVVLDRDGVINHDSGEYIKSPDEWVPIEGSIEAIAALSHAGWTVTVATNQSGLARGLFTISQLHAINKKMDDAVRARGGRLHGVFFCPHGPRDDCDCRKPRPGLLREIGLRFDLSLEGLPVIGDSQRDLDAANAVGARPILVLTGNGEKTRAAWSEDEPRPDVFEDLAAAARHLIDG